MPNRVLSLLLLSVLLLWGCSTRSTYEGDRVEERPCRWCGGSGVESADAYEGQPPPGVTPGGPCVGCRGAKTLEVVIPGPNHPAWVKGTVRNAKAVEGVEIEMMAMENNRPMDPVAGAVAGARLRFEGTGEPVEISSNSTGRFRLLLVPGSYKVTVEAEGYAPFTSELAVQPRKEPLWEEKARLVTPEQEEDTTYFDALLEAK